MRMMLNQLPSKLPFFPSPYPDELLYSIVSRYHQRACNTTSKLTRLLLFETDEICTDIAFPFRLKVLCNKLPDKTLLTVKRLIRKHTMLPLYSPFLPSTYSEENKKLMAGPVQSGRMFPLPKKGVKKYTTYPTKGIKTYLRFCPECVLSDLETYGESFWHRSHQIYGIDICHKHAEWLMESELSTTTSRQENIYVQPSERMFRSKRPQLHNASIKHHHRMAKSAAFILNNHNRESLDVYKTTQRHHTYLQRSGYATHLACVYLPRLKNDLVGFYKEHGFSTAPIEQLQYDKIIWLESLLKERWPYSHPINHLMLINYLGMSWKDFVLEEDLPFHPFGRGPWPCLNTAAPHFRYNVVEKCDMTGNEGVFSCSCGFKYMKRWPYKDDASHYKHQRVISYGDLWEKELLRLRNEENLNFTEIGRRLAILTSEAHIRYDALTLNRA